MDSLIYVDLLKRVHDKLLSELPMLVAECRGPRGFSGVPGEPGKDGKDFVFSEHEDEIRNIIKSGLPKFSDFSPEEVELIRGFPGKDGRDFNFSENKDEIDNIIKENLRIISDSLKLKFSDLTPDEIETVRGPMGPAGKSFSFSENEHQIKEIITSYISGISETLKFTFDNFTKEQLESLRGPAGSDGKDFDFEAHKEFVRSLPISISDLTAEQRESLRLKFSDLTSLEISLLRGPRGQRGSPGRDGIDGKDGVDGQPGRDGIDGKDGVDGQPGRDGIDGKDGEPGVPGRPGRDGIDGKDGVDGQPGRDGIDGKDGDRGPRGQRGSPGNDGVNAPTIKSVKTLTGHGGFRMVFTFSDSTKVVSDLVKFSAVEKAPAAPESRDLIHGVVCGHESFVGAAVRLSEVNGVRVAELAIADSEENSNFIGFIHSISDNYCTIVYGGIAENLFSDLNPIKTYYLSDTFPGVVMPFPPDKSGSVRLRIGQPTSENSMLIRVGEREVVP